MTDFSFCKDLHVNLVTLIYNSHLFIYYNDTEKPDFRDINEIKYVEDFKNIKFKKIEERKIYISKIKEFKKIIIKYINDDLDTFIKKREKDIENDEIILKGLDG